MHLSIIPIAVRTTELFQIHFEKWLSYKKAAHAKIPQTILYTNSILTDLWGDIKATIGISRLVSSEHCQSIICNINLYKETYSILLCIRYNSIRKLQLFIGGKPDP